MIVPDYTAPVVGYRVWQWDSSSLKSLNGELWCPGRPLVAQCRRGSPHQPPRLECSCGIYSAKGRAQLAGMGLNACGFSGEVYLWGTVVEHSLGWRAQFAYPKSIVLPSESLLFGRFVQRETRRDEIEGYLGSLTAYGADLFVATPRENAYLGSNRLGYDAFPARNVRLWSRDSGYDLDLVNSISAGNTKPLAVVPMAVLMEGRSPHLLMQNGAELRCPAEIVFTEAGFPLNPRDPLVRQIQHRRARAVVLSLNLENHVGGLQVAEIIARTAGHLEVAVRCDPATRAWIAHSLGFPREAYLGRDCGYDILDDFVFLSKPRIATKASGETTPPTASVYAPIGRGPRPLRPRAVALRMDDSTLEDVA